MSFVVEARNLAKRHKAPHGIVTALEQADAGFSAGEVTVVTGPSGSGKTTLLSLLGGLEAPTDGEVVVDGKALKGRFGDLSGYRLRQVGFVFQANNLLPHLTAIENVTAPMLLAGRSNREAAQRAAQLLEAVGIGADRFRHRPSRLSGGQQQRVAIARALANEPRLILADEPTGNLDEETSHQVFELLEREATERSICVVVVTHDVDLARKAARVIRLKDGKIVADRKVRHVRS